mmetsp:Transcript_24384/g.51485  ORF Transcript_24384/g.51485 Transcript_24384/m.51485 type:complete len:202 (-) Transcript_24384:664-1269(-)
MVFSSCRIHLVVTVTVTVVVVVIVVVVQQPATDNAQHHVRRDPVGGNEGRLPLLHPLQPVVAHQSAHRDADAVQMGRVVAQDQEPRVDFSDPGLEHGDDTGQVVQDQLFARYVHGRGAGVRAVIGVADPHSSLGHGGVVVVGVVVGIGVHEAAQNADALFDPVEGRGEVSRVAAACFFFRAGLNQFHDVVGCQWQDLRGQF